MLISPPNYSIPAAACAINNKEPAGSGLSESHPPLKGVEALLNSPICDLVYLDRCTTTLMLAESAANATAPCFRWQRNLPDGVKRVCGRLFHERSKNQNILPTAWRHACPQFDCLRARSEARKTTDEGQSQAGLHVCGREGHWARQSGHQA